ncbi:MAG TPA: DUF2252 family protein [Gemmatimonadales bacterium]|nr:DUF2252 family protein [Gemmatimonadales bacterium]
MSGEDVTDRILRYNAGRDPERLARKFAAMRATPFTFFRATAHLFYEARDLLDPVADAPAVWSSGDVHLENFGCYKGDNGLAYFDLNDFDEAGLAPLTWDLVRLVASALIGAGPGRLSPADRTDIARTMLTYYREHLREGKARWIERATAEGPVRQLLRQAKRRTRRALLSDRTQRAGRARVFRLEPGRHHPAPATEHRGVKALLKRVGREHGDPVFYKARDVVRRVAGMASLGTPRFAVLVEGRGSPNNNYLLDLKEAIPSTLAAASPVKQPHWASEADRVVTVQNWVQAVSPALLTPVRWGRHSLVLRELQPTADRLRAAQWRLRGEELDHLIRAVTGVTAWGHLRAAGRRGADGIDQLIAFGESRRWRYPVLAAARAMARRTLEEWNAFRASDSAPAQLGQ